MLYDYLRYLFGFLDQQDVDIRIRILKIFEKFEVKKRVIEENGSFKLLVVHFLAFLWSILSFIFLLIVLTLARILYQILNLPKYAFLLHLVLRMIDYFFAVALQSMQAREVAHLRYNEEVAIVEQGVFLVMHDYFDSQTLPFQS